MTSRLPKPVPGILLCIAVALAGYVAQRAGEGLLGQAYLDALILALLGGIALRTVWTPGPSWRPGIVFSAGLLLEIAVFLLGASLDLGLLATSGPALLAGIVGTVAAALGASFAVGQAFGLPPRVAILIACGNSICGNSAIAAVAPVIGAKSDEVAAAISFTAVLGVVVVLALPLLIPPFGLSAPEYGILAGLTVYAVPQVLAATLPIDAVSAQVGTLVKLVRVLMLGPVVVGLSLVRSRFRDAGDAEGARPGLFHLVPWFIIGFLLLATLRSAGLLPAGLVSPLAFAAKLLTVVAMAGLGLGVDVRVLGRLGGAVTATVVTSLAILLGLSLALIRILPI